MVRNYLKTAWRNLLRNKFYSGLTIAGLTVGLAVGMLILFWVQDELSFDGFHRQAADIYKLENRVGTGTSQQIWQSTAAPIGMLAKAELPEVKNVVRLAYNSFFNQFKYQDKSFIEEEKFFTDPSFFTLFDFNLLQGDSANPFPDDHSIVITEATAKRYFGADNPIGKTIIADDNTNFRVSGLVRDFPKNSLFRMDMLFPMSLLNKKLYEGQGNGRDLNNDFHQYNYATFLLLQPGADLKSLATKIRNIHLRMKADDTDIAYLLLPLKKMHLYKSDGSEAGFQTVRMFTIIALLILVIACINYVNLATARSMLRSREVSLRKIAGAAKLQLFVQFTVETAFLFILAAILAMGLLPLLMPAFNAISGKALVFNFFSNRMWLVVICTIIGTLVVSSIYPAILLSSFEPLNALKGKMVAKINDVYFRKLLVVIQFSFSIILICGTFIIGKQLKYIESKDLGYNKDHVFTFFMREMGNHYDAVKASLLKTPGVLDVTRSGRDNIVSIDNTTGDNDFEGKEQNATFMVHPLPIDKDFIPFFKIGILAGKNFTGAVADSAHVILNETAVRESGIKDPIGKKFRVWKNNATIIGVVKDFHFSSVREKISPVVFYYNPGNNARIYIRTDATNTAGAIVAVEKIWKNYNASYPLSYSFLDETYLKMYQADKTTGTLFNIFACIAILISCLGLLGLTAYTAQLRTREIGIRKVLGASIGGIVNLLALDFIKLVVLANLIALPIAWFTMNRWLEEFAYRVKMGWTVFLFAAMIAIVIAIITMSFQSIRTALANPVKSLKSE